MATMVDEPRDEWALTETECAAEFYRCDPDAVTPEMLDAYREACREEAQAAIDAEIAETIRQNEHNARMQAEEMRDARYAPRWTGADEPF